MKTRRPASALLPGKGRLVLLALLAALRPVLGRRRPVVIVALRLIVGDVVPDGTRLGRRPDLVFRVTFRHVRPPLRWAQGTVVQTTRLIVEPAARSKGSAAIITRPPT